MNKKKLLYVLTVSALSFVTVASYTVSQSERVIAQSTAEPFRLETAKWSEPYNGPEGYPKGAQRASLGVDAKTGGETYYGRFPAGSSFALHWHAHAEYAVVLRGKVTHTLGQERRAMTPGDYVVIPPRTNHGWDADPSDDVYLLIRRDGPADFNFVAQKTSTVSANGLLFAYVEEGSGPPVVLLHGSVSDYREWAKQMRPLARHHRVIAYSRRYHWPNNQPSTAAESSLELQVEDLAAIIKTLNIAPAHLVGHSYGGAVALHLALRHPELVRTLVLAEPGVAGVLANTPEDEAARKEGQALRAEMKEAFSSGDAERIVRTMSARVAPGVFEKAEPEFRQMLLANVVAFQLDYNSRRPPFTCDEARRITVPVLVFAGELSPPGLRHIAKTTAGCLKTAEYVSISHATHWLPHDQPQKFNEALLAFLARHGK